MKTIFSLLVFSFILLTCKNDDATLERVEINPATAKIKVSECLQFKADLIYSDDSRKSGNITWESKDTNIATVTSNGLVCGIKPGTVGIYASNNGKTDAVIITIIQ